MLDQNDTTLPVLKKWLWTGRVMTTLPVLFMLFDATIHILKPQFVVDAFVQLGYNPNVSLYLGVLVLICVILYIIPRTSVLGAILLTGYLGGAVATNVRVGNPLFSHVLFPVYVGIFLWGALYVRDSRVRNLIPLTK